MQGTIDWDDLRYLLAAQQTGSFAAAARRLRVDQATVGRRMRALHQAVGTPLLERTRAGLALTEAGRRAVEAARAMDEAALRLERTLAAGVPDVAGPLRITATDALACHVILPHLPALTSRHAGLVVEVHASNERLSLSRREADIAVRLQRPAEPAVVARRAGSLAFGLYASRDYLRGRGAPDATFRGHDVVGYDRRLGSSTPTARWPDELTGARVAIRCNGTFTALAATAAGLGVGALPCFVADEDPRLVRVVPQLRTREIWLAVHGDLRRSARARVGLDFLAGVLAEAAPRLRGDGAARTLGAASRR